MKETTTDSLNEVLKSTRPADIRKYLDENREKMLNEKDSFGNFIRDMLEKYGRTQREVFIAADISERYGYKLLSGEKHTSSRDYILRICISAGMNTEEVQQALRLYGMPVLYPRIPRDALVISAVSSGMTDVNEISDLLMKNGMEPLMEARE